MVEEFLKTRNQSTWNGESFGSAGAAAFPGLSKHAGRGAFDLKFRFTLKEADGNEFDKNSWGKASNNSKVRATAWWQAVDKAFSDNDFQNLNSEYWHFNYLGCMSDPERTLDVSPLRQELKYVAIYANMVEYDLAHAIATCQKAQIEAMDRWPSVIMLEHSINRAAELQLGVIDNTASTGDSDSD